MVTNTLYFQPGFPTCLKDQYNLEDARILCCMEAFYNTKKNITVGDCPLRRALEWEESGEAV